VESTAPPILNIFSNKSAPSRFCYENYFYAQHTGKKDEISQVIEEEFAKVEGVFSKEIPRIEKKIINNEQISDEDKYYISTFMFFSWIRGKKHRQESQEMTNHLMKELNKRIVRLSDKDDMEKHGITKEEMIELADKGEYSVDMGNMHHMALLKDIEGFSNLLFAKYWKIYISRNGEFIATDAPYMDRALRKEFWANDFLSREQTFILSPRAVIVALYPKNMNGKKIARQDITNNKYKIHTINTLTLMNSVRFGFHKDKSLLEEMTKYTEAMYEYGEQVPTS
jgi:hypothetical protein